MTIIAGLFEMPRYEITKSTRGLWSEVGMAHVIVEFNTSRMKFSYCGEGVAFPHHTLRTNAEEHSGDDSRGLVACKRDSSLGFENGNFSEHKIKLLNIAYFLALIEFSQTAFEFMQRNGIQTEFNDEKDTAGFKYTGAVLSRHPEVSTRKVEAA
jgi:hypothetical protein